MIQSLQNIWFLIHEAFAHRFFLFTILGHVLLGGIYIFVYIIRANLIIWSVLLYYLSFR